MLLDDDGLQLGNRPPTRCEQSSEQRRRETDLCRAAQDLRGGSSEHTLGELRRHPDHVEIEIG
jgi:hypothetical protein